MRHSYESITDDEKSLLQDQFEASPFFNTKDQLAKQPIQLDVFDFDSTLFLSPSLSPTIWHPDLINLLLDEDNVGPGWWKDIRSLDLGPAAEASKWKDYWNESVVKKARRSLEDPTTLTIILTGRRAFPFQPLIERMTASQDLAFGIYGLRPDPNLQTQKKHSQDQSTDNDTLYGAPSTFANTFDFKTAFLLNVLHNIPTLRTIHMWDDRIHHVKRFNEYLSTIKKKGFIDQGHVTFVEPVRPRYRPLWEYNVVSDILSRHQDNWQLYDKQRQWNRRAAQLDWTKAHDDLNTEHNDSEHAGSDSLFLGNLISLQSNSTKGFPPKERTHLVTSNSHTITRQPCTSLTPIACSTVIQLDEASALALRQLLEPAYLDSRPTHKRWMDSAEQPTWFGHQVRLSGKPLRPNQIKSDFGQQLGDRVSFRITQISSFDTSRGLLVQVHVTGTTKTDVICVLPLAYLPSEERQLWHPKWHGPSEEVKAWIGHGTLAYSYRFGLKNYVRHPPRFPAQHRPAKRQRAQ
ncbi:hypothetical protein DM01DRAFT_1335894 [Hesseltinella vesiculosa]|uniref:Swiss Army Knife RNA repair protein HAD domain-containing protein n=1 Tax=Hesseltinella vesiculosa TaxID=101127 RepID=A0A1X2GHR9_9FUNG|nr:hypothetical protein DM01DRAFT_1335894 [Hesseltinella vesiculosa]